MQEWTHNFFCTTAYASPTSLAWHCDQEGVGSLLPVYGFQCAMLTKGIEQWHHGVSLFATLALQYLVDLSIIIFPEIL